MRRILPAGLAACAVSLIPAPAHATGGYVDVLALALVPIVVITTLILAAFLVKGPGRRKLAVTGAAFLILLLSSPLLFMLALLTGTSGFKNAGLLILSLIAATALVIKCLNSLIGEMKPKEESSSQPVWAVEKKRREEKNPSALALRWQEYRAALAKNSRTIQCAIGLAVMAVLFLMFYVLEWSPIVIR